MIRTSLEIRLAVVTILIAGAALSFPASTHAGTIDAYAEATSATQATVHWTWTEIDGQPTNRPDWYGYDVLRRATGLCTDFERINPTVILRSVGVSHSRDYVDTPPLPNQTWEYRVIFVDVNRTPLTLIAPDCLWPCQPPIWATVPALSAPVTAGVVRDMGWALYIESCAGSCWPGMFFSGPAEQEIRDQGRIDTEVALYGTAGCCTVEGPWMNAVSWQPTSPCTPVPTLRRSWGQVKTIYR